MFGYDTFFIFELFFSDVKIDLFYKKRVYPIVRFSDFFLKVDLVTFVLLRRFLEYFRVFKYNEYISYTNYFNYNDKGMNHFLVEEKHSLLCRLFLIINIHSFLVIIF